MIQPQPSKKPRLAPGSGGPPAYGGYPREPAADQLAEEALCGSSSDASVKASRETYIAYVKRGDDEEVETPVKTLFGEYEERGLNHGRKVYQKLHTKAAQQFGKAKPLDVLLYYWDDRDGASFEGWWFGNKLGGTQVWAHCKSSGKTPPTTGWKIPWNGYARPDFALARKEDKLAKEARQRLQVLTLEVDRAESDSDAALSQAKAMIAAAIAAAGGETSEDGSTKLAEAESILSPQALALSELERKATEALRLAAEAAATGNAPATESMRGLRQLGNRVKAKKESLTVEYTKAKGARQKAEADTKQKVEEEQDTAVLEAFLPEAVDKTNTAEDLVEKAVIALEYVADCREGGDDEIVKQALLETERAAKEAFAAVGEARIFLSSKLAESRGFAPRTKERAATELGELQKLLQVAQKKLAPATNARKGLAEKNLLQKLAVEAEEKLAFADLDVDRAEEAALLLGADPSQEGLERAMKAVEVAEEHISSATQFVEARRREAPASVTAALEAQFGSRGKDATERLQKLKGSLRDGADRVTASASQREAKAKVQSVTIAMQNLEVVSAAAESLFGQGGEASEGLSSHSSWEAKLKAPETAAVSAQTAATAARSLLQMKLLEAKRFSGTAAAESTEELQVLQKQLEVAIARIAELKADAVRRRQRAMMAEAEACVARAECFIKELGEASAVFGDPFGGEIGPCGLPADMTAEQARGVVVQATGKERKAVESLGEARKFLAARQVEAKGKGATTQAAEVLAALQSRLAAAQADMTESKKRFASVEQRLSARNLLSEVEGKLKEAESKVAQTVAAAASLPSEDLADDLPEVEVASQESKTSAGVKSAEAIAREAHLAIRALGRLVDLQSRTNSFAREALQALRDRIQGAQTRLDASSALVRDCAERGFVRSLLKEAKEKARESKLLLTEADSAAGKLPELPSADTATVENGSGDPVEVGKTVLAFERIVQAAQTAHSSLKTCVAMKRLSAKRLSERAAASAEQALDDIQAGMDSTSLRLGELRAMAMEAKMTTLRRGR